MHKQGLNINAFCLGLYLWEEVFIRFSTTKVEGLYHVAGESLSFFSFLSFLSFLSPSLSIPITAVPDSRSVFCQFWCFCRRCR